MDERQYEHDEHDLSPSEDTVMQWKQGDLLKGKKPRKPVTLSDEERERRRQNMLKLREQRAVGAVSKEVKQEYVEAKKDAKTKAKKVVVAKKETVDVQPVVQVEEPVAQPKKATKKKSEKKPIIIVNKDESDSEDDTGHYGSKGVVIINKVRKSKESKPAASREPTYEPPVARVAPPKKEPQVVVKWI